MKRYLTMLLAVSLVFTSFCYPVHAAAIDTASIDGSFINGAVIDVSTFDDGIIEVSLSEVEEIQSAVRNSSSEDSFRTTSLTFLANTQEERDNILSRINEVKRSGGTVYDDDWFFSNSCYIYISVAYTTRNVSNGTEARINSVTTRHSANSGTSVSNAILHLACIGSSSDVGGVYLEDDIRVTTSPYTNTSMNTWPYIHTGGPCLGANYTVTATRSSGSSSTHTVYANVFVN